MGQALYRKYRSKSLAEIVGQEHITDTLAKAVGAGRISHAYLFTGPRGVGKTSIARILAHEINGLPYVQEDNHIDIIEIDAASNRGIDEIRDLREKVYMAPVAGKYKVYIIDEVHMLTTQAFNALLKTLEEPPQHAVFILATTEAHKLPDTIISRTQRHIFRPVEQQKVVAHLRDIASSEKIQVDDAALELFAAHGGGSFRDSISLLDQAGSSGTHVTLELAESMLGIPSVTAIETLLQHIVQGNAAAALQEVERMQGSGFHPAMVAKQLGSRLRTSFVAGKPDLESTSQLALMRALLDVAPAHDPLKILELAILGATPMAMQQPQVVQAPAAVATKPAVPKAKATPSAPKAAKAEETVVEEASTVEAAPEDETPTSTQTLDASIWGDILNALKKEYNTLYGVMRMAVPEFSTGKMTLRFKFAFHQKRMNEAKHRKIVGDIVKQLTGETVTIECLYDKAAVLSESPLSNQSVPAASTTSPEALAAISNIFGGGELIES